MVWLNASLATTDFTPIGELEPWAVAGGRVDELRELRPYCFAGG